MRGDEYLMTLVSMVYAKRLRCNGLTLCRQIIHLLSAIFYLFHTLPQAKFFFHFLSFYFFCLQSWILK